MSKFTSLFLKNFIEGMGLGSTLPTTSVIGGFYTSSIGIGIIDDSENSLGTTLGTAISLTGASVAISGPNAYKKTMEELQLTQAYIESLDEQQLYDLIAKLEIKNGELSFENTTDDTEKQLTFTKN